MLDEKAVRNLLRSSWAIGDVHALVPQVEAMNSLVWLAEYGDGERVVVKAARESSRLESGLLVAAEVERRGIAAGAAWPTADGALTVRGAEGWDVALLTYVPGRPLDSGCAADTELWGSALGRLHRVLLDVEPPADTSRWPWAWPGAGDDHLATLPDVQAAVGEAVAAARRTADDHDLTLGVLHSDPGAGCFRIDEPAESDPTVAVIDWGPTIWGPLLYDVASSLVLQAIAGQVAHAGTFLAAYEDASPVPAGEVALVDVFVRLRWAVQAWWFAWRLAEDDHLGLRSPAGNEDGLATAMAALTRPT